MLLCLTHVDYYPTTTGGKWCATFAMIMGVLVIAFPVSVFSELWSHELKQIKGFKALNEDDDDNDDGDNGIDNNNKLKEAGVKEANKDPLRRESAQEQQTHPRTPERQYDYNHNFNGLGLGLGHSLTGRDDVILMSKEDMKEIVECLYTIRENERQMKNILRKYHPEVISHL